MLAIPLDSLEVDVMSTDASDEACVVLLLRKAGIDAPLVVELTEDGLSALIDELKKHQCELYPKGVFRRLHERKQLLRRKQYTPVGDKT